MARLPFARAGIETLGLEENGDFFREFQLVDRERIAAGQQPEP